MSFLFVEIAREKFSQPANVILEAMNIDPTPEGFKVALIDFAMSQREKYDQKSPLQQLIFLSFWMNTALARPAVSLLVPAERIESMKTIGMSDALIYTAAGFHSGLDHFIPPILIGAYALIMKEHDIPGWLIASGSFLGARATWGIATSIAHIGAFTALEAYNSTQSRQYIPQEVEGVL